MKARLLLAVTAFATLLVFGAFLWWFGPWYATLGYGLWAILTAPLLMVGYGMTRKRWLLYLGSYLCSSGIVVAVFGSLGSLWGEPVGLIVIMLSGFVPLTVTAVVLSQLLRQSASASLLQRSPVTRMSLVLVAAAVNVGMFTWAIADSRLPVENAAYARRFAGCYEITFSRWVPGGALFGEFAYEVIPRRFQLDRARRSSIGGNKPIIRPGWSGGDAYWLATGRDEVGLFWNSGLGGVSLKLWRRGNELRGRAVFHSDADSFVPMPHALARAWPIDCALVPADTVSRKIR